MDFPHPLPYVPPTLTAVLDDPGPWPDGFTIRGQYAETFWAPILGPTCLLMARRLAYKLSAWGATPDRPLPVTLVELGAEVGLRARGNLAARRLGRIVQFGLATLEDDRLTLPAKWPMLSEPTAERLPPSLRPYARPPRRTAPVGASS